MTVLPQLSFFLDILADHGLVQVVDKPTRQENVLDLLAVNNPTLVNRVEVIPGISDHDVVFAEIDIQPQTRKQTRRKVPVYRKVEWNRIEDKMKELYMKTSDQIYTTSVDSLWNTFKSTLLTAISEHVPHRNASNRDHPPWITTKIKKMINARNHLYKKIQSKPSDSRKEELKALKKCIKKATKQAYWNYTETIISENAPDNNRSNNKKLWTFIKHRKTDLIDVAPLKDNGILKDSPQDKAEILNKQFSSVFSIDSPSDFPNLKPWRKNLHIPDINDIQISGDGVLKLLNNLNIHKAMGPDELHPRVLKQLAPTIAPILQLIFQKSIDSGQVPSDWKTANVCPIFKKGQKYDAANYRPVSLTCVCSKLLEHIVTKHAESHLEKHNILYDMQHGFRSKRSTETQLIAFTQGILKNLSSGQQTDIVIMDFAKAFDKVSHWRLAVKLKNYGITGSTNKWIEDFLNQRTQRVVCNGWFSDWASVKSGVPP